MSARVRECAAGCAGGALPSDYDYGNLCAACLGSGRVLESIPASDAVCDAETLRNVARMYDDREAIAVETARTRGDFAMRLSDGLIDVLHVGRIAAIAGRNAFRAVPALREEAQ